MIETGIYQGKGSKNLFEVSLCDDKHFPCEIRDLNGKFVNRCEENFLRKHYNFIGKQIPIKPMEMIEPIGKYRKIGESIGALVDEKNQAYGDSFNKSAEFLKILFPSGVPVEAYSDMLGIIRVFDKLMRIATNKDALGENPWKDICGYSILKSEE